MDWITASAEVRQGHPAPEERSRERLLAWRVVQHAVEASSAALAVGPVAAALWHHVDWLKKRCPEL